MAAATFLMSLDLPRSGGERQGTDEGGDEEEKEKEEEEREYRS